MNVHERLIFEQQELIEKKLKEKELEKEVSKVIFKKSYIILKSIKEEYNQDTKTK